MTIGKNTRVDVRSCMVVVVCEEQSTSEMEIEREGSAHVISRNEKLCLWGWFVLNVVWLMFNTFNAFHHSPQPASSFSASSFYGKSKIMRVLGIVVTPLDLIWGWVGFVLWRILTLYNSAFKPLQHLHSIKWLKINKIAAKLTLSVLARYSCC